MLVERKREFPYSLAVLFCLMNVIEEKEREMEESEDVRDARSRYTPPPLIALQEVNLVDVTDTSLVDSAWM